MRAFSGFFSFFGDARFFVHTLQKVARWQNLNLATMTLLLILLLHSSCLRNSCVLKYSGMGSSYLAITL